MERSVHPQRHDTISRPGDNQMVGMPRCPRRQTKMLPRIEHGHHVAANIDDAFDHGRASRQRHHAHHRENFPHAVRGKSKALSFHFENQDFQRFFG
jgi:hypothetical protein